MLKKHSILIIYTILVILYTAFVICDGFIIPKKMDVVENHYDEETANLEVKLENFSENSYEDNNISIKITNDRKYESNIYIVDFKLKDIKYLKTAFAQNSFGKNVIETTSQIAQRNNAILAINGDFYGFRENGYVLKNGVVYRSTARNEKRDDYLAIYNDGTFKMGHELKTPLENIKKDAWQIFTFGPALIKNSKIINDFDYENANTKNPRTAIGYIDDLHYVIICCDGRTDESKGLILSELAEYLLNYGCKNAYNLDGGSSTTLYFNGNVINKPSNGFERQVSDIVYIGY